MPIILNTPRKIQSKPFDDSSRVNDFNPCFFFICALDTKTYMSGMNSWKFHIILFRYFQIIFLFRVSFVGWRVKYFIQYIQKVNNSRRQTVHRRRLPKSCLRQSPRQYPKQCLLWSLPPCPSQVPCHPKSLKQFRKSNMGR